MRSLAASVRVVRACKAASSAVVMPLGIWSIADLQEGRIRRARTLKAICDVPISAVVAKVLLLASVRATPVVARPRVSDPASLYISVMGKVRGNSLMRADQEGCTYAVASTSKRWEARSTDLETFKMAKWRLLRDEFAQSREMSELSGPRAGVREPTRPRS